MTPTLRPYQSAAITPMTAHPTVIKRAAPVGQSCENCRFSHSWLAPRWYPGQVPRAITECRRWPPVFLPGEDCVSQYPNTIPGGWCGEWRAVE